MCKTIKQKVKFQLPPERIYQLLADSKLHSILTGKKALISKKVGGAFSTHAGDVTGINVDLAPGKRLVQAWRRNDFPDGIYSMAAFQFSRTKDNGTNLILTHRGVPKDLIPSVEINWKKSYWERIRSMSSKNQAHP